MCRFAIIACLFIIPCLSIAEAPRKYNRDDLGFAYGCGTLSGTIKAMALMGSSTKALQARFDDQGCPAIDQMYREMSAKKSK